MHACISSLSMRTMKYRNGNIDDIGSAEREKEQNS